MAEKGYGEIKARAKIFKAAGKRKNMGKFPKELNGA